MFDEECLPRKLREARNFRGLSQDQLAKMFGITAVSYSKWERGINHPNATHVVRIANFERMDISFFFVPSITPEEAAAAFIRRGERSSANARYVKNIYARVLSARADGSKTTPADIDELYALLSSLDERSLERLFDMVIGFFAATE